MNAAWQREAHDPGVVNDDDNDRERTEKIETRLTLAISKTRINCELIAIRPRLGWRGSFRHG
jgi:hypothetical protein